MRKYGIHHRIDGITSGGGTPIPPPHISSRLEEASKKISQATKNCFQASSSKASPLKEKTISPQSPERATNKIQDQYQKSAFQGLTS